MISNTDLKVLGKGTYGCVFYPSINACNGKIEDDIDSGHYITKIQQSQFLVDEYYEIEVGKLVQKIPLYYLYFAPVVKSCKINMVNMDYNLVKTCAYLQNELGELNKKASYISNKVRYVGKHILPAYIRTLDQSPEKLYRKMINTHLYILEAIQLLYEKHIIHFDIKPQNIVYDDIQNIPIIIDFGLARDITSLTNPQFNLLQNEKTLHTTFINHYSYAYWCIDIHILSNMGTNNILKITEKVTTEKINKILDGFFTSNLMAILSTDELNNFKDRITSYFSAYITREQTWQSVYTDLIQYYNSWDNYSAAMTYLYTYYKCPVKSMSTDEYSDIDIDTEAEVDGKDARVMQQYISILKNIVISMPDTRQNAEQTREHILELVNTK